MHSRCIARKHVQRTPSGRLRPFSTGKHDKAHMTKREKFVRIGGCEEVEEVNKVKEVDK